MNVMIFIGYSNSKDVSYIIVDDNNGKGSHLSVQIL